MISEKKVDMTTLNAVIDAVLRIEAQLHFVLFAYTKMMTKRSTGIGALYQINESVQNDAEQK
jgi:hypothetical protein